MPVTADQGLRLPPEMEQLTKDAKLVVFVGSYQGIDGKYWKGMSQKELKDFGPGVWVDCLGVGTRRFRLYPQMAVRVAAGQGIAILYADNGPDFLNTHPLALHNISTDDTWYTWDCIAGGGVDQIGSLLLISIISGVSTLIGRALLHDDPVSGGAVGFTVGAILACIFLKRRAEVRAAVRAKLKAAIKYVRSIFAEGVE